MTTKEQIKQTKEELSVIENTLKTPGLFDYVISLHLKERTRLKGKIDYLKKLEE